MNPNVGMSQNGGNQESMGSIPVEKQNFIIDNA